MPPHPLPPLPGAALSETPPPVSNLHTHSNKFPIEREVILSSTDKNSKIPILSEYNKRPKSAVAPEGPAKQVAWTESRKQIGQEYPQFPPNSSSENTYVSYQSSSRNYPHSSTDIERGNPQKDEKTKITKTYHTIRDMISSKFNKTKEDTEHKQMNNQPQPQTQPITNGETKPNGSRERLIDGFPNQMDGMQQHFQNMELRTPPRGPMREPRNVPPLPVLRGNAQPNFSGMSDVISPIAQSPQRRLPPENENIYQRRHESDMLSQQQLQRRMQAHPSQESSYSTARVHPSQESAYSTARVHPSQENVYSTARAHLVQTIELPTRQDRYYPSQDSIYQHHPMHQTPIKNEPLTSTQQEGSEGNLTANLESNGVYISRTPRPRHQHDQSETDDDGGFKKPSASVVALEEPKQEPEPKAVEEPKQPQISSATSSDYEKATRRSVGQGSSIGDSGRGSAAYSSGRLESGRGSTELETARNKAGSKERLQSNNESCDEVKTPLPTYSSSKSFSKESPEWVDIVESELRQILDPKHHTLGGFGSGRGSTMSESVSSLTPPLPPLSPGGGSSPTPTPRHMRYKHFSLPHGMKPEYEQKYSAPKSQRSVGSSSRGNWNNRGNKNSDKSRLGLINGSKNKIPLATFGMETDIASTTTGPLDSVLDSRLSDHSSDEDLSTTIDANDALAIRRQLQGLETMYSEVLKLLGVKKYGTRYQPTDPRSKRRYGSMSSLPSSVSSRPMRDKRRDERKKVKDMKGINKRFQRLESHVVTLARSVAHLSSEMRTQHLMMQEMENIRSEISNLRAQTVAASPRSQSVPKALNSIFCSPLGDKNDPTALTNPARVKKLTKFFGDEPPLLRLFLKRLGYEKYAHYFENERIGMVELPYLTEERLQKMGVPMGPRLRILQEAQISFCRDSVYVV